MKKCPFCAEEIQDEAIKCRYCGEWIRKDIGQVKESGEESSINTLDLEKPESKEANKQGVGEETGPTPEDKKEEEKRRIEAKQIIISEKPRWSWGWLVLLAFFIAGISGQNLGPVSDETRTIISLVRIAGIIILMFLYFRMRKRLIKKAYFKEIWLSSFVAGTISYLIAIFLAVIPIGLIARADLNKKIVELNNAQYEIATSIINLNKEEISLWGFLIDGPSSVKDIENNKQVLERLLILLDNKAMAFSRLIENAKEIDSYRNKLEYSGLYSQIKQRIDEYLDIYKRGIQLRIEYYETFDEKKFDEGTKLLKETDLLGQDILAEIAKIVGEWRHVPK